MRYSFVVSIPCSWYHDEERSRYIPRENSIRVDRNGFTTTTEATEFRIAAMGCIAPECTSFMGQPRESYTTGIGASAGVGGARIAYECYTPADQAPLSRTCEEKPPRQGW